ncbi:MAG: TIGR03545 family protein, partial [Enterobacterales bacterium]|nr:TIGR03545 family protein [Enterobacterales bacterium]
SNTIRTAGSQVIGAQVDLESAELNLDEEKLALSKLAVTNPKSPMTNALQADYLELNMDASALTWNKVIVDNIQITNLLFNTPRESRGELTNHWTNVSDWEPLAEIQGLGALANENLPDPKDILAQEELQTLKAIEQFKTTLAEAEKDLNSQLNALPNDQKIQAYKERLDELKASGGGNKLLGLLSKGKEIKELRKDLKADLAALKTFKNSIQSQRKQLSSELKNLKSMPAQDLSRLKQKYSLSGDGVANLVSSVFGPQIGGWVKEGYGYYQLVQPYLSAMQGTENDSVQASKVLTNRGRKVVFQDDNPLPDYLIKAIDISTPDNQGQLGIAGKINNLTTQPERWAEPLDMQLRGTAPFLDLFTMAGTFDRRISSASKDNVQLKIAGLNIETAMTGLNASSAKPMPITATDGAVDIVADIKIENQQLQSEIRLNFKKLAVTATQKEPWVKAVVDGLTKLSEFEIILKLTGDVTAPTTSISSPDLRALSQQVIKSLLSDELQGFETELMQQIRQATDNPLANLPGLDNIDALQEQLNLKELDLNKLLKNLG